MMVTDRNFFESGAEFCDGFVMAHELVKTTIKQMSAICMTCKFSWLLLALTIINFMPNYQRHTRLAIIRLAIILSTASRNRMRVDKWYPTHSYVMTSGR